MKKEYKLLILLARITITKEQKIIISKILKEDINWEYFILIGSKQKVLALVYNQLISNKLTKNIDIKVLNLLRAHYFYMAKCQKNLKSELLKINNLLNDKQINHVIIKGFSLVEKVYKKIPFLRNFNDIDILIEANQTTYIKKVLLNEGYIQGSYNKHTNTKKMPSREEHLIRRMFLHEIYPFYKVYKFDNFMNINEIFEIDINFTIFDNINTKNTISTSKILQNKEKIYLNNDEYFFTLNNTYFLIQLLHHLYRDIKYVNNLKLLSLCDVREFILAYNKQLDWNEITQIVNNFKLNTAIYSSLYFTNLIFTDLKIDNFLESIKPQNISLKELFNIKDTFINKLI